MRHLLFHVAVDYPTGSERFRRAMAEQEAIVQQWWGEPDFERVLGGTWQTKRDVENAIHDTGLRDLSDDDALMLILTGHGRLGQRHYLQLPATAPDNLAGTAFPTIELVLAALGSGAEHVVVVVNCCHSGQLRGEIEQLVRDLPSERQRLASVAVFTTARYDERPRASDYAELLRRTLQRLRETAGIDRGQLTVEEFRDELVWASEVEPKILEPLLVWPPVVSKLPSPCLPNPGYRPLPTAVDHSLAQVSTSRPELDYWLDRATGRTDSSDPGWYFAGRENLTREIADFLASGAGALVVTGAAATGKSALIARAVTLSDASLRNESAIQEAVAAAPEGTVPEVGSIDAAVLARQKNAADIAADLVRAFDAEPRPAAPGESRVLALVRQMEELIEERGRVTIVIDGVDESVQPGIVLSDVVGPLLRFAPRAQGLTRLMLGVRSSAGTARRERHGLLAQLEHVAAGTEIRWLHTDGPEARDDIAAYVDRLLVRRGDGDPTLYTDLPQDRRTVADALAAAVAPSFLDARIAAERLRRQDEVQDVDDPVWMAMLGDGTYGLLTADVREEAGADVDAGRLLAVLQAAAFAQGNGVPWAGVWPAMIEAMLDKAAPDADDLIRRVLGGRLEGYLTRDVDQERIVYRPAHDLLSHALRRASIDGEGNWS